MNLRNLPLSPLNYSTDDVEQKNTHAFSMQHLGDVKKKGIFCARLHGSRDLPCQTQRALVISSGVDVISREEDVRVN